MRCARDMACRSFCGFQSAAVGRGTERAGRLVHRPACAAASLDKASSLPLICTSATRARAMCAAASTHVMGTSRSVEQYAPSPLTRIKDDDGIGGGQVDAQTAGARGQQESKIGGACGRGRWQGVAAGEENRPIGTVNVDSRAAGAASMRLTQQKGTERRRELRTLRASKPQHPQHPSTHRGR